MHQLVMCHHGSPTRLGIWCYFGNCEWPSVSTVQNLSSRKSVSVQGYRFKREAEKGGGELDQGTHSWHSTFLLSSRTEILFRRGACSSLGMGNLTSTFDSRGRRATVGFAAGALGAAVLWTRQSSWLAGYARLRVLVYLLSSRVVPTQTYSAPHVHQFRDYTIPTLVGGVLAVYWIDSVQNKHTSICAASQFLGTVFASGMIISREGHTT